MRIKIDDAQKTYIYQKGKRRIPFLLLGKNGNVDNPRVIDKINRKNIESVPGFWGTLGHAENKKYKWSGHIECSGFGNEDSSGITLNEIKELYSLHDSIAKSGEKVIERYIDLDFLNFDDYEEFVESEELPELRLTIFLETDEGAEVYLQHYTDLGKDADIEYILCEPTNDQETNKRDRLTYNIPIIPKKQLLPYYNGKKLRLSDLSETSRFVIKILTFKRESSESSRQLLSNTISRIIGKGFKVVKFDTHSNTFKIIDSSKQIDTTQKTLILIHGTISSINGSFNALLNEPYKDSESWLKYIVQSDRNNIQQIIGIDHDTLTKSAIDNADQFVEFLGNDFNFAHPVTLLSTSRGGIVIKALCGKYGNVLDIDRAITVACANYCGYFVNRGSNRKKKRAASMLVTGLSKMSLKSTPWWRILKLLGTQSYSFLLSLPGLESMTKGTHLQSKIQNYKPSSSTKFYPIIGREKAREWFWGALGQIPKQVFINRLLTKDHDWVLGTEQQLIVPTGNLADEFHGIAYENMMLYVQNHTTYLNSGKADLNRNGWDDDVKHLLEDILPQRSI